jgi:predicted HTH transcriptional regulator
LKVRKFKSECRAGGMMNKKELTLILREGEGLTVEFKENVNSDLSKELIAMANSISKSAASIQVL